MEAVREKRITEILRDEMPFQLKQRRGVSRIGDKKEKIIPYRPGIKICMERPRLITESYKETDGLPMVLRRAKALAHILDNMTIWIGKNERIVGNFASTPNSLPHYPELFYRWLDKAIEKDYKMLISDEERSELHQIHKFWKNLSVHGSERRLLPEEVLPYWRYDNHGAFLWLHGGRTGGPNYDKIFKVGLNGIIKQAEERLEEIASDPDILLDGRKYLEQKYFLDAAIISLKAAARWGKRYAEKARELAKEETSERKKELLEIAEICDWVPGNPPRTLHEALQSYYFILVITRVIDLQTPGTGDRFDQIMYPFYIRDIEEGRLTREQAQELVEFVFLKQNEFGDLVPPMMEAATLRVSTIGGLTPDGDDATNEMTYIALDAKNAMGLAQPALAIRLNRKTPKRLMNKIRESLRTIAGVYSFFNDDYFYLPHLASLGIPIEDARNYAIEGCMRWVIPGKAMGQRALAGNFVLPKCLEYALCQGVDKFSGKQWGASTSDPLTFTSIEDVIQAYLAQVRFFTEKLIIINNMVDALDERYLPQPLLSALMDGCIEHGQDCRVYKYFAKTIIQPVGQTTVVNSLAAMKKLVFEDNKVSMAELLDTLKNNWEGREEMRQMFINAPKFGNDDDYVDLLGRDVHQRTNDVICSFKNIYGGHIMCDGTGGSSYWRFSGLAGATPDGREDREVFNDGTISPVVGTDKKGPTAVLKSVGKIDHVRTFTQLFNMKFHPEVLADKYEDKFASFMKTWLELGIHHIQFNIIDKEILLDAQKNPEKHSGLVVRVAGFSAYFIDLAKGVQDQIIARTENASV